MSSANVSKPQMGRQDRSTPSIPAQEGSQDTPNQVLAVPAYRISGRDAAIERAGIWYAIQAPPAQCRTYQGEREIGGATEFAQIVHCQA